jgi:hypothetical protein
VGRLVASVKKYGGKIRRDLGSAWRLGPSHLACCASAGEEAFFLGSSGWSTNTSRTQMAWGTCTSALRACENEDMTCYDTTPR